MSPALAELVVAAVSGYGLAGIAVGVAFLAFGIDRIDPHARGAFAFRPLLLPGLALLWPLVLSRWMTPPRQAGVGPQARQIAAHRIAWIVLAILLPALLGTALVLRQDRSVVEPPVRLAPPAAP